jgi:brefeldin A-resistance guanine nucleotide exchange factor 1
MPVKSLVPLVSALLAELPDDPTSVVISVKSENEPQGPANGQKAASSGPVYDPAMVYLLELCTVLALRDVETVVGLGAAVAEALQNVMRNAASYHAILISRTMFYLLHLLHASYVSVGRIVYQNNTNICRNTISSAFQWYSTRYQALKRISSTSLLSLFSKD